MKVLAHIQAFLKDEEGASGIEYALVAAMVAVGIASFVTPIRTAVVNTFTGVRNGLTGN